MKNKKNNEGFTMIELIIVIAVIGIIGAILAPTYGNVTTSARLTTDISTIKTLQQLIDLYYAEMGVYPTDIDTELQDAGYLDAPIKLQTGGSITFSDYKVKLSNLSNTYEEALKKLSDEDKERWISGGGSA